MIMAEAVPPEPAKRKIIVTLPEDDAGKLMTILVNYTDWYHDRYYSVATSVHSALKDIGIKEG